MKTLRIMATLVPAVKSNIMVNGVLQESRSIFYKRHGVFSGPRFLEYEFADELLQALDYDLIYIIKFLKDYNPQEVPVIMRIRQAGKDDFQWTDLYPRQDRVYYRNPEGNKVEGPLYYVQQTNKAVFNELLAEGRIYVPQEGQRLEPHTQEALAS